MVHPGFFVLAALARPQLVWAILWSGLGALTIGLITLMVTRFGQSQPLRKCIVLSLWAHLLMAVYATSVDVVFTPPGRPRETAIRVADIDDHAGDRDAGEGTSPSREPWNQLPQEDARALDTATFDKATLERAALEPPKMPEPPPAKAPPPPPLVTQIPEPRVAGPEPKATDAPLDKPRPGAAAPELIAATAPSASAPPTVMPALPDAPRPGADTELTRPAAQPTIDVPNALLTRPSELPRLEDGLPTEDPESYLAGSTGVPARAAAPAPAATPGVAGPTIALPAPPIPRVEVSEAELRKPAPALYSLRASPRRAELVERQGGSAETEAAVRAALKWLAANQSPDGRWDASVLEAGRERRTMGQDRRGAGTDADTGITGLALLAFLGAGHTHRSGDYRIEVHRALRYLVDNQGTDGNLGGNADAFAFMYCHAMAGLALSEACAMTRDANLIPAVRRAAAYTLSVQNRATGGWRYRPQDLGDLSQLGWQLMLLKGAELAGVQIPATSRDGMRRFLNSVASGKSGGLASYRPGERTSRTMTAEALVCRQFLGGIGRTPANDEAAAFLLEELPGTAPANLYYWYYATLGLYQLHESHWQRWNEAAAATLVATQSRLGNRTGSWDPDTVWGGYGGRVYATALSTLCLEVYYRYLPLYVEAAGRDERLK